MSRPAALALLADLAARGIEVGVEDGSLRARPKGALDEALRARVAALRTELLAELETRPDSFTGMVCDLFDGEVVDDTPWETALLPANACAPIVFPKFGDSVGRALGDEPGRQKPKPSRATGSSLFAGEPDRRALEGDR